MRTAIRNILFQEDDSGLWDLDVFSSAELAVWLSLHPQATRQSAITIATGVSAATDVSGNTRNFTQGTGVSQPAYQATGFNGFPCVNFDGSNDSMSFSCPQNYNQVVMAVIDTANLGTGDRILLGRSGSEAPACYLGTPTNFCPSLYWGTNHRANQPNAIQRFAIFFWQIGGNVSGFNRTNVDAKSLVSQENLQTTLTSWLAINSTFIQQSAIKLSELAILENPSQDIIDRVHGIWAHRWWRLAGQPVPLDASHPYYSSPPLR